MSAPWLLLQLADGTFPSGGFAHSNGLEAASVLGDVAVEGFLDASLRQAAKAALPFVTSARDDLSRADDECDALLLFHGPNLASRAQGRALTSAVLRVWDHLPELRTYAGPMHHAPMFGAIFAALGVSDDDTRAAYMHGLARSILSAGVRLGLLGPLEAQKLHAARAPLLTELVASRADEPAQTAPMLEIYAALHKRLDGRMFQS